jgi:hypothetical protein
MQPGLTHTRQPDLLAAAERIESDAYYVALVLRKSRLELWVETEGYEEYVLIMDDTLAQQYAEDVLYGRLTVPSEDFSYEAVVEDEDSR